MLLITTEINTASYSNIDWTIFHFLIKGKYFCYVPFYMKANISSKTNPFPWLNGKILPAVQAATSLFDYRAGSDVVCLQVTEADGFFWHVTRPIYHSDILVTHPWWDGSRKCSSGRRSGRRWIQSLDEHHCCHQAVTCLALCLAGNPVRDLDVLACFIYITDVFVQPGSLRYLFQVNLELQFKLVTPAKARGSGSTNRGFIWCYHPAGHP